MRYVLLTLALIALFAVQALANDGNVSNATLEKMGLSAMKTMTDVEGTLIRGNGYSMVWSSSYASGGVRDTKVLTNPPSPNPVSVSTSSTGTSSFAWGYAFAFKK
jgi:hypothetical protein